MSVGRIVSLFFTIVICSLGSPRLNGVGGARAHWSRLSGAYLHNCAIQDDGRVQCWGANGHGQVGDGTLSTTHPTPALVSGLSASVSVGTGFAFSCALTLQSAVFCWGANDSGQLGYSGLDSLTPVSIPNLGDVTQIAVGYSHVCALKVDGTVWCWGSNSDGQLGRGVSGTSLPSSPTPAQVPSIIARSIASGGRHTCAVLGNGTAKCWGANDQGQLGNSSATASFSSPSTVSAFVSSASALAVEIGAGASHTCVVLSDATVNCWGLNTSTQLGTGSSTPDHINHPVASTFTNKALAIAMGTGATCVVQIDGTVVCWGNNDAGVRGVGVTSPLPPVGTPVQGVSNAIEVNVGADHACARTATGAIQCWGYNAFGEHGNGNTAVQPLADTVLNITGTVSAREVSAGAEFTCAIRGTGAAACWGNNATGQLGQGTTPASSPNALAVSSVSNAIGISASGSGHACEVNASGGVKCWGNNASGQLGGGASVGTVSAVPVSVVSSFLISSVSAGYGHSCGVTNGGLIRCWGANGSGQLGTGDQSPSNVSVQAAVITNAIQVAAGSGFTCALVADGTVFCWGSNSSGQIGDNSAEAIQLTPKKVIQVSNAVAIAAGEKHVCAVTIGGGMLCWGDNSRGQIGNGTTSSAPQPVPVQTTTLVTDVTAGGRFSCAGTTFTGGLCWGSNSVGELAAADTAEHLTPTAIIGTFATVNGLQIPVKLSGITSLTAGKGFSGTTDSQHTCALKVNGAIACWGANGKGEIGDGTTTNRARPTAVNSFTANVAPTVTLQGNGRVAVVTVLINCPVGAQAHITLALSQGDTTGIGRSVVQCEDRLLQEPMEVPAQGKDGFDAGLGLATVEALVIDSGDATEDQHWTKAVVLTLP